MPQAQPSSRRFRHETRTFDLQSFARRRKPASRSYRDPRLLVSDLQSAETDPQRLMSAPKFKTRYFIVDFDAQKDAVKYFGVRTQSTLIAFKGLTETGRSVGDTERSSIAALLNKTL